MQDQTKTTTQEIQAIATLINQGQLVHSAALARELVARVPQYGVGWKALAVSLNLQGEHAQALPASLKAAELMPDDAEAHNNLGLNFKALGQLEPAEASLRRALELKDGTASAHFELGFIQHQLGLMAQAEANYLRAVQLDPQLAEAHNNLGVILRAQGRLQGAEACLRRALQVRPDYSEAHGNLGLTLQEQGQLAGAEACYRRALEIAPLSTQASVNLGITLREMGRSAQAEASFRQALAIDAACQEAHVNLALVLQDQGLLTQAEASNRQALALNPASAEAHNNLGDTLRKMGRLDAAESCYREALKLRPDWLTCQSNLLFTLSYTASDPDFKGLAAAREYGRMASRLAPAPFTSWQRPRVGGALRVGLVSGDLRNHPVGFFLEGLLAQVDKARIEFIAYSSHHIEDELSERIRPHFSAWRNLVGLDDASAARMIHADGLDILIDLSGHTGHNRLPVFAWKPAPVQVSWLGYFGTTGVEQMDFVLADAVSVPEAGRRHFTERICYLPDTRLCLSPPSTLLEVSHLPALQTGHITFGCFQNLSKINDETLQLWARILAGLPNAQLSMRSAPLADSSIRAELADRMQRLGIAPERVAMQGGASRHLYLATHANVDVILDTFPYPGGTTTCESLWMGVPTLTRAGETMLSRQGASLLAAAGLRDWIAADADDYVDKALARCADLEKLAALRMRLREQVRTSPLFDAVRFARNFEDAMLRLAVRA